MEAILVPSKRNRKRGKHPKKAGPMLTRSKVEVTSIMDLPLPSWNTLRSESSNKNFRSFFKVHVRGWHSEMSRLCCSPVARLNPVTASPVVWRGRARGVEVCVCVGVGGTSRQATSTWEPLTVCGQGCWKSTQDNWYSLGTFLQQYKCWFPCFA